jgi:hypothetical protein
MKYNALEPDWLKHDCSAACHHPAVFFCHLDLTVIYCCRKKNLASISKTLLLQFHLVFKNCISQTALLQAAFKVQSICNV